MEETHTRTRPSLLPVPSKSPSGLNFAVNISDSTSLQRQKGEVTLQQAGDLAVRERFEPCRSSSRAHTRECRKWYARYRIAELHRRHFAQIWG